MKLILTCSFILFFRITGLFAQVSITTDNSAPNSSAMLDVKSTDRGLLPPRMNTAQRNAITAPASGLLIFNTDCNDMQYFNGTEWIPMGNQGYLATPEPISGNPLPCVNTTGNSYTVTTVPNAGGYHWTVPPGAVISTGQGTPSITVSNGTQSGMVCVAAYNNCYRSGASCIDIQPTQPGQTALPLLEGFNGSFWPSCWSQQSLGTGVVDSWAVEGTANAGGNPGEMKSMWQSVNPGVTRLVTVPINTLGLSQMNLSFRHMLDAYNAGATLGIQSSVDGVNWTHESWSVATTGTDIPATVVNTTIANNLNSASTYVAFTITGDLYQYDYWYIDNVQLGCSSYSPVSVAVSVSANPVCEGTAVTFAATPSNGGTLPVYQWKVNGNAIPGASNATYIYEPDDGDEVWCILSSDVPCSSDNAATSNTVTMTVQPNLGSVSISASANPVCSGSTVTFTATPANGGIPLSYQWLVNGSLVTGATNPTYTFQPANNNQVSCILTSNDACPTGNQAASNTITMVVQLNPVSVSVSPSANPACPNTIVTFTATPVNGGTSPAFQWRVNGDPVPGASNPTYAYAPDHLDQLDCILTSNAPCPTGNPAMSNTVYMTVQANEVSVSVSASANPTCPGSTVTFTATPVNGGTSPTFEWFANGSPVSGATNPTYAYAPENGDLVKCILTSNVSCPLFNPATSNTITMAVQLNAVSVYIDSPSYPCYNGYTPVTFNAHPTNGGTSPSYAWQVNGSTYYTGGPSYTFVPNLADIVLCILTSNAPCPSGNPATSNFISIWYCDKSAPNTQPMPEQIDHHPAERN